MSKIVNAVLEYESKFNGLLKGSYKSNNEEFLNDLTNEVKEGTKDLLEYYKMYAESMKGNTSNEERQGIMNLISILGGNE